MEPIRPGQSRAERIRRFADTFGLTEDEATFYVDLADGKHKGDIVGLSDDERRALGLDRSALDDLDGERASPVPAAVTSSTEGDRAGES